MGYDGFMRERWIMKVVIKSERGIALPTTIMIMLITFTLASIVLSLTDSQVKTEIMYESSSKAIHAAEAGIHVYLWSVNKESASVELDTVVKYPDVNPEYAYILHEITNTSSEKTVKSTGWLLHSPDIKQTITVTLKKRSFTNHVYFTDEEPEAVYWTTGENCYGPYRTNSNLYISGAPNFHGEVYYVQNIVRDPNRTYNPYFRFGATKTTRMDLPNSNNELKTLAQTGGYYIEGRTSIMMNDDGTITIWNPKGKNPENRTSAYTCDLPANGVIYVNDSGSGSSNRFDENAGNVFISGTLKGRLTVASSRDIYITDYNPTIYRFNTALSSPTNGVQYKDVKFRFNNSEKRFDIEGTGDDMLGLIAQHNVIVLTKGWFDNNNRESGRGDINVHAAVMAIEGKFMNSNPDEFPYSSSNPTGGANLIVRGAIIQKERGMVGMFYSNSWGNITKVTGYNKDYAHDIRMENEQPPNFLEPEKSGWEVVTWK